MILNIQHLRAWAALAVVFFHMAPHFKNTSSFFSPFFNFIHQFGYAGVDVFFVISGYVIWISSSRQGKRKTPLHFLYNRAARIYMGYWPYFIFLCLLLWFLDTSKFTDVNFISSFFLTELNMVNLLLKVTWTLVYEMYFYVLFAFLLLLPSRLLPKALLVFALAIVLIQSIAIFKYDIYSVENFPYTSHFYTFFFSPFCLQFLSGCAIGMFFEHFRLKHLTATLTAAMLVFIFTLWYQNTYILPNGLLAQGYYMPERTALFGVFAMLLVAGAIETELRGTRFLPRFSRLFGGASYSIYLSHIPILFVFGQMGLMTVMKNHDWLLQLAPVIILASISIYSIVHHLWIEKPLLKMTKRLEKSLF